MYIRNYKLNYLPESKSECEAGPFSDVGLGKECTLSPRISRGRIIILYFLSYRDTLEN